MGADLTRHRDPQAALWRSLSVTPTAPMWRSALPPLVTMFARSVAGPPVVFVHGTSVSGACFAPLVAG